MKSVGDQKDQLVEIPPGKYLLADKNEFLRIQEFTTGLLLNDPRSFGDRKLVLIDSKVVIIS